MDLIAITIMIFGLGLIFIQDLRYRKIHIIIPVILFIIAIYSTGVKYGLTQCIKITLYNIILIACIIGILTLYMSIKYNKFINPFTSYFGLGDLFFYIAIAPLFFLENYLLFFIFSMIFSIIVQIIFIKLLNHKTIPLAGYASLLLALIICTDYLFNFIDLTLIG